MRPWMSLGLATILFGCSGGSGEQTSVLVELCIDACAHLYEKNCVELPATQIGNCPQQCQSAGTEANTGCTDEKAALYACTAKATITCTNDPSLPPTITGCEKEDEAVQSCQSPGGNCLRSPSSDDICFNFGFSQFFVCSNGIGKDPPCQQVTGDGWCCP